MFKNLKEIINDLAYSAVIYAENALSKGSGQEKKRAAITFIINRLTIPNIFKPFITMVLNDFIDTAVEKAVSYMNKVQNEDY